MKRYSKSISYSLLMTGLMAIAINVANAVPCPTITRDALRDLCRAQLLKGLFSGRAGEAKFPNGATLKNDRKTCDEFTSIKEKIVKYPTAQYQGKAFKDEKGITCTYDIDGRIYVFGTDQVDLPTSKTASKPEVIPPVKEKPKTFSGVDITTSPHETQVEIKKLPSQPALSEQAKLVPQPPPRPHRLPGAAEAKKAEEEAAMLPPPLPPRRQPQGTTGPSMPPQYAPPPLPQQFSEAEEGYETPSGPPSRLPPPPPPRRAPIEAQ